MTSIEDLEKTLDDLIKDNERRDTHNETLENINTSNEEDNRNFNTILLYIVAGCAILVIGFLLGFHTSSDWMKHYITTTTDNSTQIISTLSHWRA